MPSFSLSCKERSIWALIFVFRSLCLLTDCPHFPSKGRMSSARKPWNRTSMHRMISQSGRTRHHIGLTAHHLLTSAWLFISGDLQSFLWPQVVENPILNKLFRCSSYFIFRSQCFPSDITLDELGHWMVLNHRGVEAISSCHVECFLPSLSTWHQARMMPQALMMWAKQTYHQSWQLT